MNLLGFSSLVFVKIIKQSYLTSSFYLVESSNKYNCIWSDFYQAKCSNKCKRLILTIIQQNHQIKIYYYQCLTHQLSLDLIYVLCKHKLTSRMIIITLVVICWEEQTPRMKYILFCVDLIYVCYCVVAIKNTNNSTVSLLSTKLGSRKTISLLQ